MIEIQPKDTSKGHFFVSLGKSALRIVAGVFLIDGNLLVAGSLLILAEGLGVVEELAGLGVHQICREAIGIASK